MVMDRVIDLVKENVYKFPSIYRIVLFGSRARGDATVRSDYDLAVFGASTKDKIGFTNLVDELPILKKIDLIFISSELKNKPIYRSILREGIVIMEKFQSKLENYQNAVKRLREAVDLSLKDKNLVIRDGVIQRYEFTTELAWKTVREYLILQNEVELNSQKPVMRAAYRTGLISNDEGWARLLNDRNITSHVYDDETANEIFQRILTVYVQLLEDLEHELTIRAKEEKEI